jgi:hypothetical protein
VRSFVIAPRGKARAVAGGYRLDGFWPFASGSQHADWLLLGTEIADEGGTVVDAAELLVPARDIVIRDDWNVVGLRGTATYNSLWASSRGSSPAAIWRKPRSASSSRPQRWSSSGPKRFGVYEEGRRTWRRALSRDRQ